MLCRGNQRFFNLKYILSVLILLFLASPTALSANPLCSASKPTVTFAGWDGERAALRQGFFVWDGVGCWRVPGIPLVDSGVSTPHYYETRAIWMSEGVIEVSAAFNGLDMNGVEGFVALLNCDLVGQDVWVRPNATAPWLRVRIVDCAMPEHEYYHAVYVSSGLELSYELAQRFGLFDHVPDGGGVGMYNFEVCLLAEGCGGHPVNYTEWYLEQVRRIRNARR